MFERVTYSIDYEQKWTASSSDYFNIVLYDAENNFDKCKPKFTYYYAYSDGQVVDKVDVYFSVLRPCEPLIVSFNRRERKTYNCSYSRLNELGWFYCYNIGYYYLKGGLKAELFKEYSKLSHNKMLTLTIGSNDNEHISVAECNIGNKKFIKRIYTPDLNTSKKCVLYSDSVFSENSESSISNLYLKSVAYNEFDGVCSYTNASGIKLFAEFFDGETLTQFRRVGTSDKSQWLYLENLLNYDDERQLVKILDYILFCLNNKIVVNLDKLTSNTDTRVVDSVTISTPNPITENEVSVTNGCNNSEIVENFICYTHNLEEYFNVHLKNKSNDLRILSESIKLDVYLELILKMNNMPINLFDETGYTGEHLYYNPDKDENLYVYFLQRNSKEHGLKPLLFYYQGQAYKPSNFEHHDNSWLRVNLNSLGKGGVTPKPKKLKDVLNELRLSLETNTSSNESPTQPTFSTIKPTMDGGRNHGGGTKGDKSSESFIGGSLGIILGMLGSAIAIFSFWNKPRPFNSLQ
ncbi:hypothetical protein MACK_004109 [Theileria orientalis]|uniref:Uncharacterized protein n=1 Tax=Theileria orientalis TaxID=68886 RepID=A0A976XJ17_THEOR|nr:hypothetical protein MACK_004109 [Theileria orientalis]